jgi:hypothetical protein
MMRKLTVLSCMLCLTLAMMADGGKKIDGRKVQKITFSGDQVTIVYNDGTQATTTDMAEVTIDFSNITGIAERTALMKHAGLLGKKVYDLNGREVTNGDRALMQGTLKKGVYVIDGKKVMVRGEK